MSNAKPLDNAKRAENYRFQEIDRTRQVVRDPLSVVEEKLTGVRGRPLSARQLRRIRRHENLAKIQKVAAATFEEKPAPVEPEISDNVRKLLGLDEPETPKETRPCGGTDFCITPKGAKAKATHKKCEAFV